MSKQPKTNFMALIAGEVAPAARPEELAAADRIVTMSPSEPEPVVTLKPRERAPTPKKRPGIKERTHQFSLYIEPEVYDVLRGIAFEERIKLHALVTEGLDLVLRKRGSPSIRELIKKAG
jgi:hypothetical protein